MSRLILSLTTVPPRFPFIGENLSALIQQTADVEAIKLYIPKNYRRFNYSPSDLPKLPDEVQLCLVDEDLGPATKVLPAAKEYRGQDVSIIFCDDDKIYDTHWAQRFVEAESAHPNHVICEEGGWLSMPYYAADGWTNMREPKPQFRKKDYWYRLRRAISLGLWKPSKAMSCGYVDIFEGWGGVLVKPSFFDDAAFKIPDLLWTVDDVWLSGCVERLNIPVWLNAKDKIRSKGNSNEARMTALRNFVYKGYGRVDANRACIKYFRVNYGIWGGISAAKKSPR